MGEELLQQLRDIHLPAEPSWWPPAPGWWLLAMLVLALAAWSVNALARERRRRRPIRRACALYAGVHARFDAGELDSRTYLNQTNELLKRLVIHGLGDDSARRLSDAQWLALLDRKLGAPAFSAGAGQALGNARFQPVIDADAHAVHEPVRSLLRRLLRDARSARS